MSEKWTPERLSRALEILHVSREIDQACATMAREFGFPVSVEALRHGLRRTGAVYSAHLGIDLVSVDDEDDDAPTERALRAARPAETRETRASNAHEQFAALMDLVKRHTRKGGISLETVCDELEMTPKAARAYLEDARSVGLTVDVAHEKLLFRAPEPAPSAPPMAVAPSTPSGRDHRIGVYSDLHYGSLYCLREQHRDFILRCYHELGVRDFFCPGDVLEGYYRHAAFERSSESWEDQANEYLDAVPQLPGMRVFFIDGNHDGTWTERIGVESGRNLVRLARERGRDDHHFFGSRGALVQYGDTRIELFHPKKGAAYALSYQLQNKIRDTSPERMPNILLCGHTHQYVKFRRSNCFAWYAGTFQHGDAPYGRSLGGDVTMGGLVLDWRMDDDGVIRWMTDTLHLAHHEAAVFDVAV